MSAHAYIQDSPGMAQPGVQPQQDKASKRPQTGDLDELLLARVVLQDRQAFDQLFRRHYPKLLAFCIKTTGDRAMAEEVADDAMLVVWRSAAGFKHNSKVSTWILGIGYRLCHKAMSRSYRRDQRFEPTALEHLVDQSPEVDPVQVMAQADVAWQLQQSLAALSDEHQATVRFVSMGHNYAEVAVIMECPENTVKSRMFYARKQLKRLLLNGNPESSVTRSQ